MRLPALALACLLPLTALTAHAKDAAVEARLGERGLKYDIDDDGDYRLTYEYKDEKRTQLVFVSGKTESVKGLSIREVFSPAGRLERDGVDGKQALMLLQNSRQQKVGAWEIHGDILYFVIKLPDSVDGMQLQAALDIAAQTADDMEIELSGDKDTL